MCRNGCFDPRRTSVDMPDRSPEERRLEGDDERAARVRMTPGAARDKGRVLGQCRIDVSPGGGFTHRADRQNERHRLLPVLGQCTDLPRRYLGVTDATECL